MNSTTESAGSCMDDYEGLLRVDAARQQILACITPISEYCTLPLRDCLHAVLATDISAPRAVPNHTNSAMDGYALRGDDLPASGAKIFRVAGSALAGAPHAGVCAADSAIRVMTGATLPAGTDTVIMQERVEVIDAQHIRIGSGHRRGDHVRCAGEDIRKDSRVLAAGHRLTAADLGVLASLGIGEIAVRRRPRVAFFSTGDELRSIGETLDDGEVYDSNRYSLYGMLRELDVEIHDLGVVRDDPVALRAALRSALALGDMVITSGGVSVGQADHIKAIMAELGTLNFWKIAIKPGRPLAFGQAGRTLFFGLPGNPVAVMVTFMQFITPALHYLACGTPWQPLIFPARTAQAIRKMAGRYEFLRGILAYDGDGQLAVSPTGAQGSGILSSMSRANCFILLDENQGNVAEGASVPVQPFPGCGRFGLGRVP